jgi:hypothetical protein
MNEKELILYRHDISKRYYELKSEDSVKAVLNFNQKKGENAEIILDGQKWQINRKGLFKLIFEVDNIEENKKIAKINFDFNKWNLNGLDNYKLFQFKNTKFWQSAWKWLDENGDEIMEYIPYISFEILGKVVVKNKLDNELIMNFIAAIGWYILIINKYDSCVVSVLVNSMLLS